MRQFIILNNGLKDHRGHYFETSVSVAEAARRAGWRPVLAAHVDCRSHLVPDWLDSHSIFRVDHWMNEPSAGLSLLHGDALERADEVRRLSRRFDGIWRHAAWAVDRAAFYLCPPLIYDGGQRVSAPAAHLWAPRILRRECRARLRARCQDLAGVGRERPLASRGDGWPMLARAALRPDETCIVRDAWRRLREIDSLAELEYALIFKQDLERLLQLRGVREGDHVLLGTAHAREVLAVLLTLRGLAPASRPAFHLEFRHPLVPRSPNFLMQRAFFSLYEQWGPSPAMRFYTDTEELSREYEFLANAPFGVLPIPFRHELLSSRRREPDKPLCFAYVGEARDEKGFHWLPGLIDHAISRGLVPGKVRFLIQANVSNPMHNPRCTEVLDQLKRHSPAHVELRGLDDSLNPEEYYRLFSQADAVLLPYQRDRYRSCSSGILAEALASGRPAVVPAGSWMSAQMPAGSGTTFTDQASFFTAVEALVDGFDECRARAEANRESWLARHSPDRLVAAVISEDACEAALPAVA